MRAKSPLPRRLPAAAVALALLLLPACGSPPGASLDLLTGKWRLVSYGPADQPVDVPARWQVTAWFGRGHLQAQGGCNYLESDYTVRGEALDFGPFLSTAMGCEPASRMQLDGVLQTALETHTAFSVEGDALTVDYPDGVLRFTRLSFLEMPTARPRPTEGPPLPEPSRTPVPTATPTPPGGPPTATPTTPGEPPTPTAWVTETPLPLELSTWAAEYNADNWTTFGCCLLDIYFLAAPDLRLAVVVEADLAQVAASGAHRRIADDLARSLQEKHGACLREVTFQGRDGMRIGEVISMQC